MASSLQFYSAAHQPCQLKYNEVMWQKRCITGFGPSYVFSVDHVIRKPCNIGLWRPPYFSTSFSCEIWNSVSHPGFAICLVCWLDNPASLLPHLPSSGIVMLGVFRPLPEHHYRRSCLPGLRDSFIFSPNPEERRWKKCFNWKLLVLCMIKHACEPLSMAKDNAWFLRYSLFL